MSEMSSEGYLCLDGPLFETEQPSSISDNNLTSLGKDFFKFFSIYSIYYYLGLVRLYYINLDFHKNNVFCNSLSDIIL
jgi:hypothetical protein